MNTNKDEAAQIRELNEKNNRLRRTLIHMIMDTYAMNILEQNTCLHPSSGSIPMPPPPHSKKITLEQATLIVKDYFARMKGDAEIQGRRYIDYLGFDVINAKEEEGNYIIECEVGESLFTKEKRRYLVTMGNNGGLLFVANEYALKKREGEGE